MTPDAAAADAAVLFAAILMLLAIAGKLIFANLIQRTKKSSAVLEMRRKEISSRLKEVQLKRTSARGTLEFWERRRTETEHRVFDMRRDVEAYVEQLGPLDGEEEYEEAVEGDAQNSGGFFNPETADGDGLLEGADPTATQEVEGGTGDTEVSQDLESTTDEQLTDETDGR